MAFQAGDIISYSASSTSLDPSKFRHMDQDVDMLAVVAGLVPEVGEIVNEGLPMVINVYPATIGCFHCAVYVETYLNRRTMSRSLELAVKEDMPVILIGQPLLVADALTWHRNRSERIPRSLVVAVGGYSMPESLEAYLRELLAEHCRKLVILHCYGVAELDAACLLATRRNVDGALLYHARPDVDVIVEGTSVSLSLRTRDASHPHACVVTGDHARWAGNGWIVWNDVSQVDVGTMDELQQWSHDVWVRRTGYVANEDGFCFQLREGVEPNDDRELSFFDFADRFGFSWMQKPIWQ